MAKWIAFPYDAYNYDAGKLKKHWARLHAGDAFTTVLANRVPENVATPYPGGHWVALPRSGETVDYRLFTGDLVDRHLPSHHDSAKVAARLMEIHAALKDSENSFTRR